MYRVASGFNMSVDSWFPCDEKGSGEARPSAAPWSVSDDSMRQEEIGIGFEKFLDARMTTYSSSTRDSRARPLESSTRPAKGESRSVGNRPSVSTAPPPSSSSPPFGIFTLG